MKIKTRIKVPTGDILLSDGKPLEFVSLADYGKNANVKACFLGLDRDIDVVKHTEMLPLSKKIVITVSTPYGCSMGRIVFIPSKEEDEGRITCGNAVLSGSTVKKR